MLATVAPHASMPRRHDLDALRAFAMLLGIGLHGMISFIPSVGGGWAVQDTQTSSAFGILMASIHGFRMPLFFLISGFFTAMLWRKRGLQSLLVHRIKRIFLPMVIAMVTIIPVTWIVGAYIKSNPNDSVSAKVMSADTSGSGAMLAANGNLDAVRKWLDDGGDVNFREQDGATALHLAILFGRSDVASLLIKSGADPKALNVRKESCLDMLSAPWGVTAFVAGLLQVDVDDAAVMAGRAKIAKELNLPETPAAPKKSANVLRDVIYGLMYFPLLGHLWFLSFLCWLVLGFTCCVSLGRVVGLPRPPSWMSVSAFRYAWLIPLTAIAQYFMTTGVPSFGPDTSVGLLPMPVVLIYYSLFFGFGALYFDADHRSHPAGKYWWIAIPTSLFVLFPIGLSLLAHFDFPGRVASAICQASYAWLMSFGMMGLFHRIMPRESKTMRYLSDSSYWLYLAHIPLIIFVQYWVRDYEVSPWLKFPVVCIVTSFVLLVSYQLVIRYSPIGTLLNGKRVREPGQRPVIEAVLVE